MTDDADRIATLGPLSDNALALLRAAIAQWGGVLVADPANDRVVVMSREPLDRLRDLLRRTIAALDTGAPPPS